MADRFLMKIDELQIRIVGGNRKGTTTTDFRPKIEILNKKKLKKTTRAHEKTGFVSVLIKRLVVCTSYNNNNNNNTYGRARAHVCQLF